MLARYVRIRANAQSSYLRLREVELLDVVGGTKLPVTASATSQASGSETPAHSYDGNNNTIWANNPSDVPNPAITYDLGGVYDLVEILIYWQTLPTSNNYTIECSLDNISWDALIWSPSSGVYQYPRWNSLSDIRKIIPKRLYRVTVTDGYDGSWWAMGRLELLDSDGDDLLIHGSKHLFVSQSQTASGEFYTNVINADLSQTWTCAAAPAQHLYLSFDSEVEAHAIRLSAGSAVSARAWKSFNVSFSDDAGVTWEQVGDFEDVDPWTASEVRTYSLGSTPLPIESDLVLDYKLESFSSDLDLDYSLAENPLSSDLVLNYDLLEFFASDLTLNYEALDPIPTHLSQLPVLAVVQAQPDAHLSQLPVLALTLPDQGLQLTQLPVLVLTRQNVVPPPLPLIPIIPIREVWNFRTVVTQAISSREQRSQLRDVPRYELTFDTWIEDDAARRAAFDIVYKYQGKEVLYPFYSSFSHIVQPSAQGTNRLYFELSHTDLREGEGIALFNIYTMQLEMGTVAALEVDGATLTEVLPFDVSEAWAVCPLIQFRMLRPGQLAWSSSNRTMRLALESTRPRVFQREVSFHLVTLVNGIPIVEAKHLDDITSALDAGFTWLDNDTSIPKPLSYWPTAYTVHKRSYVFDRESEMDYWRAFVDLIKGRQQVFLVPGFSEDLPRLVPFTGGQFFTTPNIQADEYLKHRTYRYLRIQRGGQVLYRRVIDRILNFDENGDPVSLTVKLDTEIPQDAPVDKISLMMLVRLSKDAILIDHYTGYSVIQLEVEGTNE